MSNIDELIEQLRKSADFEDYPIVASFAAIIEKKFLREAADALEKLQAELKQVKRERDAAVEGLRVCSIENNKECQYCLYRTARSFCWNCTDGSNWKFRGQKEG